MPENEIVGEALVALRQDELKEMGITSMGHRLTILKGIYDMKVQQDIAIESDHYIPLCECRLDRSVGIANQFVLQLPTLVPTIRQQLRTTSPESFNPSK